MKKINKTFSLVFVLGLVFSGHSLFAMDELGEYRKRHHEKYLERKRMKEEEERRVAEQKRKIEEKEKKKLEEYKQKKLKEKKRRREKVRLEKEKKKIEEQKRKIEEKKTLIYDPKLDERVCVGIYNVLPLTNVLSLRLVDKATKGRIDKYLKLHKITTKFSMSDRFIKNGWFRRDAKTFFDLCNHGLEIELNIQICDPNPVGTRCLGALTEIVGERDKMDEDYEFCKKLKRSVSVLRIYSSKDYCRSKNKSLKNPRIGSFYLGSLKNFKNLKKLIFCGFNIVAANAFFFLPKNLEHLEFDFCDISGDKLVDFFDLKKTPLKTLKIHQCSWKVKNNFLTCLPDCIEDLEFSGENCTFESLNDLFGALQNKNNLRYLNLEGLGNITKDHLRNLFLHRHDLEKLNIRRTGIEDLEFLKQLNNLKELDISGNDKIEDEELGNLSDMKNLCVLNIAGCPKITDKGLSNVPKSLLRLDISGLNRIDGSGIGQFKKLRRLRMRNCDGIFGHGLSFLSELPEFCKDELEKDEVPRLCELDILGCSELDPDALKLYLCKCKNLKFLSVSSGKDEEAFNSCISNFENLRYLKIGNDKLLFIHSYKNMPKGLETIEGRTSFCNCEPEKGDLKSIEGIKKLSISSGIDKEGCLPCFKQLKELAFIGHSNIETSMLCEVVKMPSIKILDFSLSNCGSHELVLLLHMTGLQKVILNKKDYFDHQTEVKKLQNRGIHVFYCEKE